MYYEDVIRIYKLSETISSEFWCQQTRLIELLINANLYIFLISRKSDNLIECSTVASLFPCHQLQVLWHRAFTQTLNNPMAPYILGETCMCRNDQMYAVPSPFPSGLGTFKCKTCLPIYALARVDIVNAEIRALTFHFNWVEQWVSFGKLINCICISIYILHMS